MPSIRDVVVSFFSNRPQTDILFTEFNSQKHVILKKAGGLEIQERHWLGHVWRIITDFIGFHVHSNKIALTILEDRQQDDAGERVALFGRVLQGKDNTKCERLGDIVDRAFGANRLDVVHDVVSYVREQQTNAVDPASPFMKCTFPPKTPYYPHDVEVRAIMHDIARIAKDFSAPLTPEKQEKLKGYYEALEKSSYPSPRVSQYIMAYVKEYIDPKIETKKELIERLSDDNLDLAARLDKIDALVTSRDQEKRVCSPRSL